MGDPTVKELEQRVEELEATVRGLTDELVDTTERLRQLENGSSGGGATQTGGTGREGGSADGSGSQQASEPEPDATADHPVQSSSEDDGAFIEADGSVQDDAAEQAEQAEEETATDTNEGEDSDDIIVA